MVGCVRASIGNLVYVCAQLFMYAQLFAWLCCVPPSIGFFGGISILVERGVRNRLQLSAQRLQDRARVN